MFLLELKGKSLLGMWDPLDTLSSDILLSLLAPPSEGS